MVEMNCPACGAGGRVPRDKIGTRLVCKKCLKVFHLTPSGQAVLGEPPAPKVIAKDKISKEPTGYETTEALEALASKVAKVRLPPPKTMAIVGGIALVLGLGYWLFSRQSLEKRARIVAEAIASSEIKRITDMAVEGTETDVIMWYADVYQRFLGVKVMLGREPYIKIEIPGNSGGNNGLAIATFSGQNPQAPSAPGIAEAMQPIPSKTNAKDRLDVRLYFVVDALGNWRLDGSRTSAEKDTAGGQTP
jgi:hypothetical protein